MDEGAPKVEGPSPERFRKPSKNAFKQQRLPAWQPVLTAGTVLPTFFVIGVAFIPIGIGMMWLSSNVMELTVDYTDCVNSGGQKCKDLIVNSSDVARGCVCNIYAELDEDWEGPVFMYYQLTNFYQNHRRYVKSRHDRQLLGSLSEIPHEDCAPFDKDNVTNKIYYPCGAIANSLFNDEISLTYIQENTSSTDVGLSRKGIAWHSDKNYKFRNPPIPDGMTLEDVLKDKFAKPRDWHKNLWDLDPEDPENNGLQNEDLMVWMRTAALPNFKKLYRKVNHTGAFEKGLPKGKYKINVVYRYRVAQFSGTKSVVLSTTSILGGKNNFLGIAYAVVGFACLIIGVVFLFVHIHRGKQHTEMINVSSRTPYN